MMNKKIKKFIKKKNKTKLVCLTAYSKNISVILDKFCDLILVGDSLANVLYGMKNTHNITLEIMKNHARSVKLGVKKSLIVVDMPKGSYTNNTIAIKNAKYLINETKCDAIKIESNNKNFHIIKSLTNKKIPVMGHIGFTPQFKKKFKISGKKESDKKKLINEAKNIEKAGAFSIVLECVSEKVAKDITKILKIPTIGIGSSKYCDGQILVTDDILGLSGFYPKFVKKYVELDKIVSKAINKYKNEVKRVSFPKKNNSF